VSPAGGTSVTVAGMVGAAAVVEASPTMRHTGHTGHTSRRGFLHVEQIAPKPRDRTLTRLFVLHVAPYRQPPDMLGR
jgi:hypothetical protein